VRWLKHAFAVDPPGPCEPDESERLLVDRICKEIVRRRLSTPALLYLEVAGPLGYLGSQAMHFFRPIVSAIFNTQGYERFARYLERRGSVDYICNRLEELEADHDRRQKQPARTTGPSTTDPSRGEAVANAAGKDKPREA